MEEEMDILSPSEALLLLAEKAKEGKVAWCEDNGGIADPPPTLIAQFSGGNGFIVPNTLDGDARDTIPVLLEMVVEQMKNLNVMPHLAWVGYICEGYSTPNNDADYAHGEMEAEYKNNPATEIREGIIVTVYDWNGNGLAQNILYRYDDHGMPQFSDDDVLEASLPAGTDGGVVSHLFQQFLAYCREVVANNN